jgi:cell fate regulator YaaT (PSP1 superfamily)
MGKRIDDEFSGLPRQLAYQKRHKRDGLCAKCSKKSKRNGLCRDHLKKDKAYYEDVKRPKYGMISRYRPRKKQFGKMLPVAT